MGKDFKPTLTQINTIGEELKFQREYHNFKEPNNKYTTQYGNGKTSRTISEVLEEYMNANCEDYGSIDEKNSRNGYGEVSTKENVISAIEKGKVRGKNRKDFTYETYYLRMYCLFKIYGFLEDYEILRLFYKYKIGEPKMEKSRKFIQKVREECFEQYKKNKLKSATFLYGNRAEMVDILYMRESEEKRHGVYYMVGDNQESILLRDRIKK